MHKERSLNQIEDLKICLLVLFSFWIWSWKHAQASLVTFGTFCSLYNIMGLPHLPYANPPNIFWNRYFGQLQHVSIHSEAQLTCTKNCTSMILVYGPPPKPPNLNRHCQGRRNSGGQDAWTWGASNPWMSPTGRGHPKTPTSGGRNVDFDPPNRSQRFLSHEIWGVVGSIGQVSWHVAWITFFSLCFLSDVNLSH